MGIVKYKYLDAEHIIKLYLSGQSENSLSKQFNVNRGVIKNLLLSNNIERRDCEKALVNRMNMLSDSEKKALVKNAQIARRSHPTTQSELINRAIGMQKFNCRVGEFEIETLERLKYDGHNPIHQQAFGRFNFDIAVGNVAVEIYINTCNPLGRKHHIPKIVEVAHSNWNIIFVWINPRNKIFSDCAYNEIVKFIEFSASNPSFIGQYRVIRGTGEFYAASRDYFD